MFHRPLLVVAALAAVLVSSLPAQTQKVLPKGMDFVESPSVLTYPFNVTGTSTQWDHGGIQLLIDSTEISANPIAYINGLYFRQSQVTSTQSSPAFTKDYQLTVYTTTMTAQAFRATTSPYSYTAIINGATPTIVFSGPLNVPASAQLAVAPAPFTGPNGVYIPFNAPYALNTAAGNLLLMLEPLNAVAVPATFRVDGVTFTDNATPPTGIASTIDLAGCVVNGNSLTSATTASSIIDGGTVSTQLTSNAAGAFPYAVTFYAFQPIEADLTFLGMPSCFLRVNDLSWSYTSIEASGVYPPVQFGIPANPALCGFAAVTQSMGIAPSLQLPDFAMSNAESMRMGTSTPATVTMMYGFHTHTTSTDNWYHGTTGENTPVIMLDGIF